MTQIFSDGFENNNFSAWTSTYTTSGETASVVSEDNHHGAYSGKFASNGGGGTENTCVYKDGFNAVELYARCYVKVSQNGIADDGDAFRFLSIVDSSGYNLLASIGWARESGTLKWMIRGIVGGTEIAAYYTTVSRNLGEWYCVELHWKKGTSDGVIEWWVNGTRLDSYTGVDTDDFGNANRVAAGMFLITSCAASIAYVDCCVVADTYIGTGNDLEVDNLTVNENAIVGNDLLADNATITSDLFLGGDLKDLSNNALILPLANMPQGNNGYVLTAQGTGTPPIYAPASSVPWTSVPSNVIQDGYNRTLGTSSIPWHEMHATNFYGNLSANNITSGIVATSRLGSGTANNKTFLRGDQTWAADISLDLGKSVIFSGPNSGTGTNLGFIEFNDTQTNKKLHMKGFYDTDGYKFQWYYWNGSTWLPALATLTQDGQLQMGGTIEMAGTVPPFRWSSLAEYQANFEKYLWKLEWDPNNLRWDWKADDYTLPLGTSFLRFKDASAEDKYVDIGIIQTETALQDRTLWISNHLIVKKDFSCGGAASVMQGALILGSDWDAHDSNAQMPQIVLSHSEGSPNYPNNPKRDTLQIWRFGHAGWGNLRAGWVQATLLTSDGNLSIGHLENDGTIPLYLDIYGVVSYQSSTIRGKENVQELPDCSWLYELRPVSFDWKDRKRAKLEGTRIGLIAEEVNAVCPHLTWLDKEGKPEGVHYEWLGIPLIAEVKKLRNRVEALENQLKQNQAAA